MTVKVLIIEDEQILQDVYRFILESKGFRVHTADNGHEGLRQLEQTKPDVVLLDLFMPIMDGREFLKNIKPANHPNTKIVVYTNLSDRKTEQEMLELGADQFVLKSSVSPQGLVKLVEGLVHAKTN